MRGTLFVLAALQDAVLSTGCCLVLLGCTSSSLPATLHTNLEMPEEPGLDGVGPISLRRAPTAAEAGLHRRRKHDRSGRAAEWPLLAPIRPLRHRTAWNASMCRRGMRPPLRLEVVDRFSSFPGPTGPPSLPKRARGRATWLTAMRMSADHAFFRALRDPRSISLRGISNVPPTTTILFRSGGAHTQSPNQRSAGSDAIPKTTGLISPTAES
jgi:hypothetical protein